MLEKTLPWWRKALNYALGGIRSGFGLFSRSARPLPMPEDSRPTLIDPLDESLEKEETALTDTAANPHVFPAVPDIEPATVSEAEPTPILHPPDPVSAADAPEPLAPTGSMEEPPSSIPEGRIEDSPDCPTSSGGAADSGAELAEPLSETVVEAPEVMEPAEVVESGSSPIAALEPVDEVEAASQATEESAPQEIPDEPSQADSEAEAAATVAGESAAAGMPAELESDSADSEPNSNPAAEVVGRCESPEPEVLDPAPSANPEPEAVGEDATAAIETGGLPEHEIAVDTLGDSVPDSIPLEEEQNAQVSAPMGADEPILAAPQETAPPQVAAPGEVTPKELAPPQVAQVVLKSHDDQADLSPFSIIVDHVYDGPLDLLLDLIRKQDIDIYDIPIAKITSQFLAYVNQLKAGDVDVAGEFIYIASLLIHIKSKMLLPRAAAGPEDAAEDPRRELVERLLEHERFKNAAQMLQQKQMLEAATWSNPGISEFKNDAAVEPEIAADTVDLVRIFRDILERARKRPVINIEEESVTVGQMIRFLARRLTMEDKPIALRRLLSHTRSERALISMFLALLELVRLQAVLLRQDRSFSEIFIKKHTGFDAVMNEGLANAKDDWR